ncbi:MAG: GIY-YIG nuclease family protein [Cyanobacteria bacterium P01_D01_bin.115]
MRSSIYVIRFGSKPVYKIGYSANPRGRLNELQCGSPAKLALVKAFSVNSNIAPQVESQIHKLLDFNRLRGEWFVVHGLLFQKLIEHIRRLVDVANNECPRDAEESEIEAVRFSIESGTTQKEALEKIYGIPNEQKNTASWIQARDRYQSLRKICREQGQELD